MESNLFFLFDKEKKFIKIKRKKLELKTVISTKSY